MSLFIIINDKVVL